MYEIGEAETFVVCATNNEGGQTFLLPSGRWSLQLSDALQFGAKGGVSLEVKRIGVGPVEP